MEQQNTPDYFPEFKELERRLKAEIALDKKFSNARIYQERLENLAVFADPEEMREKEKRLLSQGYPDIEYERPANKLIHDYLSRQTSPIDIAVILHGGLHCAQFLHEAVDVHNFLFYRPNNSRNVKLDEFYFVGSPNPERRILLLENDMLSGDTLRETADFFEELGYNREQMDVFLYLGAYRQRNFDLGKKKVPELGQIDLILDRSNDISKVPKGFSLTRLIEKIRR